MENPPGRSKEKTPDARLVEQLFPNSLPTIEQISARYPKRQLPAEAKVTRVAPSPTGSMHIGGLYMALLCERLAHQSNGVYFLRVEDTDKKREVPGARDLIVDSLDKFDLSPDEGPAHGTERGSYGPYTQSERKDLYHAYIRELVSKGRAYPCFATEEELEELRALQQSLSIRPGYYKQWATWRDRTPEEVQAQLDDGKPYVIRFRSMGDEGRTVLHKDLLKGEIEMPENDLDIVLMKADGLPTYHLAHAVDDHLMGTTHVLRGDEWVASVPLHYELFDSLGFKRPEYGHIAPINKIDEDGNKRKLSKRKDPEASVTYYAEMGYPENAVIDYLMNLANAGYEEWRIQNPSAHFSDFSVSMEQLAQSRGPLFDEPKLKDIAKTAIANMSAVDVYANTLAWSSQNNPSFAEHLRSNPELWKKIFAIERGGTNPRKDISCWSEMPEAFEYFYERPKPDWNTFAGVLSSEERKSFVSDFITSYDPERSKEEWLDQLKSMTATYQLAPDAKTLRKEPGRYRGHVGELTQVLRYAITGRLQSPDLYEVLRLIDPDEFSDRLGSVS